MIPEAMPKYAHITTFFLGISQCVLLSQPTLDAPPLPPPPSSVDVNNSASAAQTPPNPGRGASQQQQNIIYEPAKPVIIDGTPSNELTDDQIRQFLEEKIVHLDQEEGMVELIRIAPGYALTMIFDVPPMSVIVGDPAIAKFTNKGRLLVLSAAVRKGDTSMQVVLPGYKVLNYHIFVEPTFATAETTINVNTPGSGGGASDAETVIRPGLAAISRTINSYDALVQEKALSPRDIRRERIMRKSNLWPFVYYDWYKYKDGTLVLTMLVNNRGKNKPVELPSSRIRLLMGNQGFPPDLVSLPSRVDPGHAATGFLVFYTPVFDPDQPFEVIVR